MQRLTWGVLAAAVALNACQGVTEPQNAGTGMARLPFTAVTPTITMTDLGTLGGSQSAAKKISPSGVVVGYSYTAAGPKHAFLWRNGTMTDLGTLGGSYSEPYGVNALGQVVGVAQTPGKYPHAFLWDDGVMTDLGTLGGSLSYALAVNERGQVVGYSDYNPLSNNTHAFLWQDGAMTDLGPFGHCCYAAASAINNRGQAVGSGPVGGGGPRVPVAGRRDDRPRHPGRAPERSRRGEWPWPGRRHKRCRSVDLPFPRVLMAGRRDDGPRHPGWLRKRSARGE